MKNTLAVVLISVLSLSQAYAQQSKSRPNIVLIMTDDQGYGDFGFTGNRYIKTPHIDALALKSTRLTDFHVSPVCAPTRASLLTGRYYQRTGVHDTYNNGAIMASEEVTLAEVLGQNGYETGIVGKWHLGDNYPFRPSEQGFRYSYIHGGGGVGQPGDLIENFTRPDSSYFNTVVLENNEKVYPKGYCTDIFTDAALEFLKKKRGKPFFLYVSYNAPHDPLQLPRKYEDIYKDLKFDSAEDQDESKPWSRMTTKDKENARKVYGMATNIDDNVGRILEQLKTGGLEESTIVIFMTDNGNQQLRFNTGFRGLKGSVYEGGTHVPFLISGGGIFPVNKTIDGFTAHIDILPTILEVARVPVPKTVRIDGKSLLPTILGRQKVDSRIFYNSWNRGWPEPYRNAALHQGRHKLVAVDASEDDIKTFALFDLKEDPYERNNLVLAKPDFARAMKLKMDSVFKELSASKHLSSRRIEVGTRFENPVVLTRQDLAGNAVRNWIGDNALGFWPVMVSEDGHYDFRLIQTRHAQKGTRATLRIGHIQRSVILGEETKSVDFKKIYLKMGEQNVEAWFEGAGNAGAPYYLEVLKRP